MIEHATTDFRDHAGNIACAVKLVLCRPGHRTIMNVETAQSLWLEELKVRGCSERTLQFYEDHTKETFTSFGKFFEKPVGEISVEEITRDSIVKALADYRSRPDGRSGKKIERSATSVRGHFGAIKAFLGWCVQTEKIGRNPALSVKTPKAPNRVPKALSQEDCQLLLSASEKMRWPERDKLLLLSGLSLGLRLAEIHSMKIASFIPSIEEPTHLIMVGKGSKERLVAIPPAFEKALKLYLPTREKHLERYSATSDALFLSSEPRVSGNSVALDATRDGLGQIFERILVKAELKKPGLRAHMARHSFAALGLSSKAYDLEELRQALGHSSLATTQGYLRVDPERLSQAARNHPFGS